MLNLKKHNILSFALCWPVLFVSLFFFFSCSHFEPLKAPNHSSKIQNEKNPFYILSEGLNLYKEGEFNSARSQLEKLDYGESAFIPALLEIQKINYIEQDWDRFFGLASYYRKKFLSAPEGLVKNFKQELLALEILALIRHCRLAEAMQIIDWSLEQAKKIKKSSGKIYKTAYFFKLKNQIGEKKIEKINWEKQKDLWPIDSEHIQWLANPKHLRMKVRSKC